MKKKLLCGACALLAALPCFGILAGCNGNEVLRAEEYSVEYMKNLMVENENVSAYSIKRTKDEGAQSVAAQRSATNKVSLLSSALYKGDVVSLASDAGEKQTKLYCTTETYENGSVKYDGSTIESVTFKKNTSVTESVYDNDGNLIGTDTVVSQDDLDSQINKIFTTEKYTFMQFVALVDKSGSYTYLDENGKKQKETITLRPDELVFDENGVAEFDKTDYYSSALTASFVIDNQSGFIYKIEDLRIHHFENGLAAVSNGKSGEHDWYNYDYYKITVDDNDNLKFTDILPNKTAKFEGAIVSNDGWTYICNDIINETYTEIKTVFTSNVNRYCYDDKGNVYALDPECDNYPAKDKRIKSKMVNGKEVAMKFDSVITNMRALYINDRLGSSPFYGLYYDLYDHVSPTRGRLIDIPTYPMPFLCDPLYNPNKYYTDPNVHYESSNYGIKFNAVYEGDVRWLRKYDILLVVGEKEHEGLYYAKFDPAQYRKAEYEITWNGLNKNKLGDGKKMLPDKEYYQQIGQDKYKVQNVFYSAGLNGTQYYQVVEKNDKVELVKLTSLTYDETIFIFQPINK